MALDNDVKSKTNRGEWLTDDEFMKINLPAHRKDEAAKVSAREMGVLGLLDAEKELIEESA